MKCTEFALSKKITLAIPSLKISEIEDGDGILLVSYISQETGAATAWERSHDELVLMREAGVTVLSAVNSFVRVDLYRNEMLGVVREHSRFVDKSDLQGSDDYVYYFDSVTSAKRFLIDCLAQHIASTLF